MAFSHVMSLFEYVFHCIFNDKCFGIFGLLCVRGVPGVLCKGHLHVPHKMQDRWSIAQAPYWQPGQKPCWHRGGCEVRQIFGGKWRKHKRSTSLCEMQTIYRLRDKLNEFGDTVWKQKYSSCVIVWFCLIQLYHVSTIDSELPHP